MALFTLPLETISEGNEVSLQKGGAAQPSNLDLREAAENRTDQVVLAM